MIVDVIFPPLLAIGGNVDAAFELITQGRLGGPYEEIFGDFPGVVLGVAEVARGAFLRLAGLAEIADRDVIRLGVGPDAGRGNAHARIIIKSSGR